MEKKILEVYISQMEQVFELNILFVRLTFNLQFRIFNPDNLF